MDNYDDDAFNAEAWAFQEGVLARERLESLEGGAADEFDAGLVKVIGELDRLHFGELK